MLLKILVALALALLVLAVVIAMRPGDFRYSRSIRVMAPPAVIFAQVNDFHQWEAWSPWAKLDPASKTVFDGPASGVGAGFGWSGNKEVGEGHMAITESHPTDLIRIRLDFVRPMKATNVTEFTFLRDDNQSLVTWTMSGKIGFMGKAFGLFVDCDKMMGDYFERGLVSLKAVSEAVGKR